MSLTLEQYESIQKYLDDKMSADEEIQFLHALKNNPILLEYFQFEIDLRNNLKLVQEENKSSKQAATQNSFQDSVYINNLITRAGNAWEGENNMTSASSFIEPASSPEKIKNVRHDGVFSFSPMRLIAIAAIFIITLTGIWLFTKKSNSTTSTTKRDTKSVDSLRKLTPSPPPEPNFVEMYNKFFQKDKAPAQKPTVLAEALRDYDDGNFETLQKINLASATRSLPDDEVYNSQYVKELGHYFKGLAFMQTNEDEKAIQNFQWVIKNAQSQTLLQKARWYLSLSYLRKGDVNEASLLLETLSKNSKATPYNTQSRELLQILKR